jgi:hypothetical protein
MSSLGKYPDWSLFMERDEAGGMEILSPAAEVSALLQKYHGDINRVKLEMEKEQYILLAVLSQQSLFVFQLASALERYEPDFMKESLPRVFRHLRILKDQMYQSLQDAGFEIIIPDRKPFDEIAEFVNVVGWKHGDEFHAETVTEVIEPIVKYKGALVRLGRVIMGAPLQKGNMGSGESTVNDDLTDRSR